MSNKNFVKAADVDTQRFPWGTLEWLAEPNVTGSKNMVTGVVTLYPGGGHERHNHEGCEENLYVLSGTGKQMLELPEGIVEKTVAASELIHIPAGVYHSTINTGEEDMIIMAVYQYAGPEEQMRNDPTCQLIPANEK